MSGQNRKNEYLYAQLVSFGTELGNWTWISVSQLICFFFAAIYFVFFLLETQHIRFTNVYVFFAIFWAIGGALLVMQTVSFVFFFKKNSEDIKDIDQRKTKNPSEGFMGAQFTRDIQMAFYFYILYFLVISASSASWLSKFGKTIGNSAPQVGVDPEWRVFNNLYNVATCTSIVFLAICLRAVIGHFYPLRVIALWIAEKNKA